MLYLYPKNAVDFTNNGDPIRHSFDEHVIRDDGFYLTFNLLLDKEEEYKKVKKEMIVGAETPDGRNQFRVYDVKKKSTQVEVTAVQLMYDFDNKEVNPFSVKNASGAQIINRFKSSFKSTLGQFTMDSSVTELHDFTTNEEEDDTPSHNALEILNRITKRWDSELMLNGFDIRMIKRLGSKTDALLYEKKNISEFEDVSSVSGMATRIHATSKFTPEGKEDEVTLSVTVDSPLINEYAQIYEKSYVNNDAKTEAELIAWVKLKYSTENIDKPSRTITVETNIIDGTEINYGDDLVMKYLVHDVDEVIRCVGYDYDPIKNTYYSVTLGDWKDSFATTLTGGIVDATNRKFNQIKNNITYISMSANGKNRNAYGPEPVPNPINGDNWYYYEFDRPDDVEYRVYQDGFWVKLDFFAAKKEVTEALDKADEAKHEAIDSYNKSITEAKAYTEQKASEFNDQMEIVRADVADTVIKANNAVAKANQSIADVGFMKVDVDAAKANAIDALTQAQTATDNFNMLSFNVDELTKTVGFKAEKTVVDNIKGTVDSHTTELSLHSQRIEARMTSTQVDSLVSAKGYVNQAQLTATSTQWNLALTQVSSDLSNLEIGGRNILVQKDFQQNKALTTTAGTPTTIPNAVPLAVLSGNILVGNSRNITISRKTGTLGSQNGSNTDHLVVGYYKENGSNIKLDHFPNNPLPITKNIPSETHYVVFSSSRQGLYDLKVEFGNKATDWSPAPEDMATVEKVASLELKIDGFQIDIRDKINIAQFNVLAGQVSSKVESATYNTKMTQLDSAINLRAVKNDITEAILTDKTIKDTRNDNQLPSWYLARYPRQIVKEFKIRTVMALPGSQYYSLVTTEVPYPTIDSGNISVVQTAESKDGSYKRASITDTTWTSWEKTADTGSLISQINISTEGILLQGKRIQLDGDVTMTAAFVTRLDALTLTAVYADVATLKTKVLTADVITSTMLKSDTALIDKIFINDANVQRFTAKTAFINSVKAVEISADKINGGIFNAATMNVIGLNAGSITSGTLRGANLDLNLNTGMQTFYNPVSAGGNLVLTQGQIRFVRGGMGSRLINYHDEGIIIDHGPENTGYTRNTSLHLKGDKAYVQFISNAGLTLQRLEGDSIYLTAYVNDSFRVQRYYGTGEWRPIKARSFETSGTANDMEIIENWIRTTNTNDTHIYIEPSRNGNIRVADRALKQYHAVEASNFNVSSERRFKSDINDFDNALSLLSSIKFHKYIKNGESEIGLITDEAPLQLLSKDRTTVDLYSLISLTGKSVQELSQITYSHDRFLNEHDKRLAVLEKENKLLKQKIEKLESAA